MVAMLGLLKAGGVYVPLDPRYPEDRLRYMAEDARALLVITIHALREQASGADEKQLVLDDAGLKAEIEQQ